MQVWRPTNFLLEALGLVGTIENEIKDFFDWNMGSTSTILIWDTFKAYMCGVLIAFKASGEKKLGLIKRELMDTIYCLEEKNKQEVLETTAREIKLLYQQVKLEDAYNDAQDIMHAKQ